MLDITEKDCRQKLRDEFMKNAHIKDPRAVDLIVVKVRHKAVCQTTHKCMFKFDRSIDNRQYTEMDQKHL